MIFNLCAGNPGTAFSVPKIMRPLLLLLLGAFTAFSQPFSAGLKVGVPLTDFINATSTQNFTFNANTNRYIIGGMAELRLPFGLAIEADALYRHFSFNGAGVVNAFTSTTTSGAWEFPLLLKYRFPAHIVRPYVEAGYAWDTLSGLTQTVKQTIAGQTSTVSTSNPSDLNKSTTEGFVMGAGIDIHVLLIHVAPEIRYTRWGSQHFIDPLTLVHSNQNQAEFLVGITF
jgi:hypothetical protein